MRTSTTEKKRKRGDYSVSIARLRGYPHLWVEAVCEDLEIAVPTLADLEAVEPIAEKKKTENYHLRRIKFFLLNPSDSEYDAVMVAGGESDHLPVYEPVFYDGRHRYVAAVVRGDKSINVRFVGPEIHGPSRGSWLPLPVSDYLRGASDTKPVYRAKI